MSYHNANNELFLTDHFLIAMPSLADPHFFHSVSYICEHSSEGAMGVIINKPSELCLSDLCQQLDISVFDNDIAQTPLYYGGPAETERGFVLHSPIGDWESTLSVTTEIGLTMSQDIIQAIADGMGPKEFIITLGYAGWGEDQLEDEIFENAWLNAPACNKVIFQTSAEQRWTAAAASMGVNLQQLSNDIGHA